MPATIVPDTPMLRILHFNDVYNIVAGRHEPVGGASRFVTALRAARASVADSCSSMTTLTAFSGDAFSPSPLTQHTDGEEIPPVLNAALVDVACIGNHDMDRGLDVMYKRMSETNFPWLLSNASFQAAHKPGFNSSKTKLLRYCVITRGGVRLGFMGLIPLQWIDFLSKVPSSEVDYEDFVKVADEMSLYLREHHQVDVVIALTHMRQKQDIRLAEEAEDIDLILGGHDHSVDISCVNGRWIVKSGTDFRTFGCIDVMRSANGKFHMRKPWVEQVTRKITEDIRICRLIESYSHLYEEDNEIVLAMSDVELDGRFCAIRSKETALGNFVTDLMKSFAEADVGMLNGGSFRSDRVHPTGKFTDKDLNEILPYIDPIAVLDITGSELLEGIENSVSQYPELEGRFCQVSGMKFEFDPKKPSGSRVDAASVIIGSEKMKPEARYICAVKRFMSVGKDGFDCFARRNDVVIRTFKEGDDLTSLVRRHLEESREDSAENAPRISPKTEGRIKCIAPNKALEQKCGVVSEESGEQNITENGADHSEVESPNIDGRIKYIFPNDSVEQKCTDVPEECIKQNIKENGADHSVVESPKIDGRTECTAPDEELEQKCGYASEEYVD